MRSPRKDGADLRLAGAGRDVLRLRRGSPHATAALERCFPSNNRPVRRDREGVTKMRAAITVGLVLRLPDGAEY